MTSNSGLLTQNSYKSLIYSSGGSNLVPVTISGCTFTSSSASLVSTIIEIVGGYAVINGCTFVDMTLDPRGRLNDISIISITDGSASIRSTAFSNLKVDTSGVTFESMESECSWGEYSVISSRRSISVLKDSLISNTFAGVSVHDGSFIVETTNFVDVGSHGSLKYPSTERHIRCGMCNIYVFRVNTNSILS
jgi:hypothetical protein